MDKQSWAALSRMEQLALSPEDTKFMAELQRKYTREIEKLFTEAIETNSELLWSNDSKEIDEWVRTLSYHLFYTWARYNVAELKQPGSRKKLHTQLHRQAKVIVRAWKKAARRDFKHHEKLYSKLSRPNEEVKPEALLVDDAAFVSALHEQYNKVVLKAIWNVLRGDSDLGDLKDAAQEVSSEFWMWALEHASELKEQSDVPMSNRLYVGATDDGKMGVETLV